MDERKKVFTNFGMIIAAINVFSMGVTIAAAAAANRDKKEAAAEADRVEKAVSELKDKVDKISEQLRGIQTAPSGTAAAMTKDSEKKEGDGAKPAQKAEDVIYVKKSSEFWFYR